MYEELVVVGRVFYTPDTYAVRNEKRFKDWKSYRAPRLAILRTCKQVHDEAEAIYLGNNLFVLPDQCTSRQPLIGSGQREDAMSEGRKRSHVPFHDRWLFSASASRLIQNISIGFSVRCAAGLYTYNHESWEHRGDFDSLSPTDRLDRMHEEANLEMEDDLDFYLDMVSGYFRGGGRHELKRLDYLEFDLMNAYCSMGCCRLIGRHWSPAMRLAPYKTSFLGVRNAEEEGTIMYFIQDQLEDGEEYLNDRFEGKLSEDKEETKKLFGIVFNPEKTSWEQWKIDSK